MERLTFKKIIEIADWWKNNNGNLRVEIAALEPLLWKDCNYNINDVVYEFKKRGFFVTMTTNASTLSKYSSKLKNAGLDLIRISWHSLNENTFKKITGGGNLNQVMLGIHSAIDSGLSIKINRVLLKGYTDDVQEQIEFVNKYKLALKFLDLYWTPSSAEQYEEFYISPQEVLEKFIGKIIFPIENNSLLFRRERVKYETINKSIIEFKIKESAHKKNQICEKCVFQTECLEGYGDYFRVFPNGKASLCYLREDLTTENYKSILENTQIPLRLVLEGRCNFNCGFPNSENSWCLKQGRGFKFPIRVLNSI